MKKNLIRKKVLFLAIIFFILFIILIFSPRIPQPLSYHNFADKRVFLEIPNFFDVSSNILFLLAGISGFYKTFTQKIRLVNIREGKYFYGLFINLCLVALGSIYYHLNPNNFTLVFDRIPIALILVFFFEIMIFERISQRASTYLLTPLLIFAFFSVIYWYYTELGVRGDLRLYAFLHIFIIILSIIIFFLYKPVYTNNYYLSLALILFLTSKIVEFFDYQIFFVSKQLISGHTLKHVFAALAAHFLIKMRLK
jgi:hypothetical protein